MGAALVGCPAGVEAEHRDSPAVLHLGIDLAEGLLVRDHFPAARETDGRAVLVADRLLHRYSISFGAIDDAGERTDAGHTVSAADLDVISAGEVERLVLVPEPPRDVDV
jgi:hypothetical protein